jgi:hypothetical protein
MFQFAYSNRLSCISRGINDGLRTQPRHLARLFDFGAPPKGYTYSGALPPMDWGENFDGKNFGAFNNEDDLRGVYVCVCVCRIAALCAFADSLRHPAGAPFLLLLISHSLTGCPLNKKKNHVHMRPRIICL